MEQTVPRIGGRRGQGERELTRQPAGPRFESRLCEIDFWTQEFRNSGESPTSLTNLVPKFYKCFPYFYLYEGDSDFEEHPDHNCRGRWTLWGKKSGEQQRTKK